MILAISFILLNLLMLFSSILLSTQYYKNSRLSERLVTAFLLYILQIIFTIILLDSLLKNLALIYIFILNGLISSLIILFSWKNIKPSLQKILREMTDTGKLIFKTRDYFLYLFLFLFLFQMGLIFYKIYYLPPHVGDVFSYHLHPMVEWFQQGKILSFIDTPVLRANENPLGSKFLHLWFVIFLREITWIEIPQFLFGIILSLTCYALMLKLNLQKNSALRYAILIFFIPSVLLQSRTCQDHLVFVSCIFMVILFLIHVAFEERYNSILPLFFALCLLFGIKRHSLLVIFVLIFALLLSRGFRGALILTVVKKNPIKIFLGISLSMAYSGYFVISNRILYQKLWSRYSGRFLFNILIPLIILVLVFFLFQFVVKTFKIGEFFKKRPKHMAWRALPILLVISVFIISNLDYLKPFFLGNRSPVMVTNQSFSTQYPAFNSKFMKNLLAFPFRIKDIGLYTSYTPDLLEKSGFGIQFFSFGLMGYLIVAPLCIFVKSYRNSIMGFLSIFSLLLLLVYFFFYFSWANYRSFIFFGVIGMISWAFILGKINFSIFYLRIFDLMILIMLVFNGITCLFEGNMSARQWKTLITIDNPVDRTSIKYSFLIKNNSGRKSWEFIDQYINPNQAIGFSGGGDAWTFPYFDNQLKRRIFFINHLPGFSLDHQEKNKTQLKLLKFAPDFIASLKQRSIRFIHLSTQGTRHRDKIVIPDGCDELLKITHNLYYFKW